MSREIKFRGLYKVRDKKYEKRMAYGQLDWKPGNDTRIIIHGISKTSRKYRRSVGVDFRTVGQFTGEYDAHNSEVFEGDICWNPQSETWGEVLWDEGAWCYQWDNIIENLHDCSHELELRGNIHENPELLTHN